MPAEKIHAQKRPGQDGENEHVRVQWHRDSETVQVAALNPQSTIKYTDEASRAAGFDIFDGFWVTLDRQRINDLIRVLRRARDQAYGRDE